MSAPELSAEEAAIVARFEAAEYPAEVVLERVRAKCDEIEAWLTAEIVTDNGFAEQIGHVVVDDIRAALDPS